MNLRNRKVFWVLIGLVLFSRTAWANPAPLVTGKGKLSVYLQAELFSRDMKVDAGKDRLRVARQEVQLTYGLLEPLEIFVKAGLGKVALEKADLSSQTRSVLGMGFRGTRPLSGGYFAGLSAQYRFGKASRFERNNVVFAMEDQWAEEEVGFFVGSKDLISAPEPDFRFYTGLRFSGRTDKLRPAGGVSSTAKQDGSIGGMIGMDYSESKIFHFGIELGAGDRSNILIRFGLVF
ncbi:MAG: hypothetical protein HY204_03450 [Nitrospirae bacterium]|nr:hypothetical protein [Nitrospirota bacterium]